jgi:hypothetical protein
MNRIEKAALILVDTSSKFALSAAGLGCWGGLMKFHLLLESNPTSSMVQTMMRYENTVSNYALLGAVGCVVVGAVAFAPVGAALGIERLCASRQHSR